MNFTSHKFASILVIQNKKEQQQTNKLQVVVNKGIGNTKNLYTQFHLKSSCLLHPAKLKDRNSGMAVVLTRGSCLLRSCALSAALLRTFNQSNLGSMFFRNFAVFSKTASVWAAAIPQLTGICSPISIPKT